MSRSLEFGRMLRLSKSSLCMYAVDIEDSISSKRFMKIVLNVSVDWELKGTIGVGCKRRRVEKSDIASTEKNETRMNEAHKQ